MRFFINLNVFVLFIILIACHNPVKTFRTFSAINDAFNKGDLSIAVVWADSLLAFGNPDSVTVQKLNSLVDMADRIKADFSLSGPEFEIKLKKEIGDYSVSDRAQWEHKNWLEYRIIDGTNHYFKRAIPNLKLILNSSRSFSMADQGLDPQAAFCLGHTAKVIRLSVKNNHPIIPVKMKVSYRLTVNADAVPDGEMVRCWLPWPHENHERQSEVKLLNSSPVNYSIASDSVEQRSVYLEKIAIKGKPVVFDLQFEYVSKAQYFNLKKTHEVSGNHQIVNVKRYMSEQPPQIVFTDEIKHLSDSIVQGISDQQEKVRRIYYWINDHVIWTGALEYSIIPFIPGYVLCNQRGDCGMQTLLFMAMARYQQIPVKWQSGWMMHPGAVNLHDWCEVFYDRIGWVPLDMSFNLQKSSDKEIKEFYISGIDSYRLIVNDGIGSRLMPEKRFPRSEPYDFQRGEVEWRGGNLYFNQWNYHMDVQY